MASESRLLWLPEPQEQSWGIRGEGSLVYKNLDPNYEVSKGDRVYIGEEGPYEVLRVGACTTDMKMGVSSSVITVKEPQWGNNA